MSEPLCPKCNNPGEPPHECPYKADIDGDYETKCTCCEDCQQECAMGI